MTLTLPTPTHPTVGSTLTPVATATGFLLYRDEPKSPALRRHGWTIGEVRVGLMALSARYYGTVDAYRLHPDPCDERHDPYTDRVEALLRAQAHRTIRAAFEHEQFWLGTPTLRFDPQVYSNRVRFYFEEV